MYCLMLIMNDIFKIQIKIMWLLHNIDHESKKLLTEASLRKRISNMIMDSCSPQVLEVQNPSTTKVSEGKTPNYFNGI